MTAQFSPSGFGFDEFRDYVFFDRLRDAHPDPKTQDIDLGETKTDEHGAATVDLALPSAARLRAAVCPGITLPTQTGAIYGRVVSAETENPLGAETLMTKLEELQPTSLLTTRIW